jgi:hypothetical protein
MQVMMVPGRVAVRLDSFLTYVLDVRGSALRPGNRYCTRCPFSTRLDVAHSTYVCFVKDGIKNFLSQSGIEPAFLIV